MSAMKDAHTTFIENLKAFRKARKWSQAQLAEFCDVSNGTIGNIEIGKTKPSFDLLVKLAKIFDVSVADFFIDIDEQSASVLPLYEADILAKIKILQEKVHASVDESFDTFEMHRHNTN